MTGREIISKIQTTLAKIPPKCLKLIKKSKMLYKKYYHVDLMDSCRLRGMPSPPSNPSSSECLGSLMDKDVCKPAHKIIIDKIRVKTSKPYTKQYM